MRILISICDNYERIATITAGSAQIKTGTDKTLDMI